MSTSRRERVAVNSLAAGKLEAIRKRSLAEADRCCAFLRTYVLSSGIDQGFLAERVGLNATALAELLRSDGSTLSLGQTLEILDAINVSPATFFASVFGKTAREAPRSL